MRIAIDIRKIGKKSTGDETYTFHLVAELMKLPQSQEHQFFLLTDENSQKITKILPLLPDNFSIHQVLPANKILWTFYSLPRFLKKNQVNILHVQYILPFYLTRKIKIVTTVHDISFRVNPKWINKKDSFLLNRFIPLSLKRADKVLTVSEFSKKEIVKYYKFPADKIDVVHPAVDSRFFSFKAEKAGNKIVKEICGDNFPFILHVSSLQPRKNVPLLIEAFGKLKEELKEKKSQWQKIKLIIVGSREGHNYDQKIEEALKKSSSREDIFITGYLPMENLPVLYRQALITVFPSAYEGFGLPLLESMASETPVIASNIGSFVEVGGEAGTYFSLDEEETKVTSTIEKEMFKLTENQKLRAEKIKLGRERVEKFTWPKMAEKILKTYLSM